MLEEIRRFFAGLQLGDGSARAEFPVFQQTGCLKTPAAPGFSALKQALADQGLGSAVAAAFPVVHPITFVGILCNGEVSKPLSAEILFRRVRQTAAAFLVSAEELCTEGCTGIAAAAQAVPEGSAVFSPLRGGGEAGKAAETASGQVLLPRGQGTFPALPERADTGNTTAVCYGAALKIPCIQQNLVSAAAAAEPYRVTVFALCCGSGDSQGAGLKTGKDLRKRTGSALFFHNGAPPFWGE